MDQATTGLHRHHRHQHERRRGLERWIAPAAFALVAAPYLVLVIRLISTSSGGIVLPDDLALIDLHTRRAMELKQQLGVFDHNGWSHPGPAYFYLQAGFYRLLGNRPATLFRGAGLLSMGAALSCVWVVLRRSSPLRALATAGMLCWLGILLAQHGSSAMTYSEGPLGALASPWNPLVVILPLLLLSLLVGAAVDGSGPSAVAAAVVASFVLQANISSGPLALGLLGIAAAGWAVAAWRRGRSGGRRWQPWALGGSASLLLVAMWVPPLVEELTGKPGNMTLIWRFFTAGHPGQPMAAGLWTLVDVGAAAVVGPSQVMSSLLGNRPPHATLGILVLVAALACSATAIVMGWRQGRRFAVGLGLVGLLGTVLLLASFLRIVGFIFGYLALWGVVLPLVGLLSAVMLEMPRWLRSSRSSAIARATVALVALACSLGFVVAAARTPSVSEAGDPVVARMASLVGPRLSRAEVVEVDDAGAGTKETQLLDTERFIGLVNELERQGYEPRVNHFWQAQFGTGYVVDGSERQQVLLETWTPASPSRASYVGKAGDMAVFVSSSR